MQILSRPANIAIIGGGPSGLMAAEILAKSGHFVTIYDRMPSLGRKFLMAGRGGLNLTHSEPLEDFIQRYRTAATWLAPHIHNFSPLALRQWCQQLGQETFIGSSGRVFPRSMKAAPLLRAWLQRLNNLGVEYKARHCWLGWEDESLRFMNAQQQIRLVKPDATLLAMGGASWPRLGSDGGWVDILLQQGIDIAPLRPANCGFMVEWSEHFRTKFSGMPLKSVTITHKNISAQGEVMITSKGIEGGAIYALSKHLRESIDKDGTATLYLNLRPQMSLDALTQKLSAGRNGQSLSNYLRKAGFSPLVISLLHEVAPHEALKKYPPDTLATRIQSLPITLTATASILRAISSAGGIKRSALNNDFMLNNKPGVFATGEMLDWEAPTGGYLLQGCFSTAVAAANGILKFLEKSKG